MPVAQQSFKLAYGQLTNALAYGQSCKLAYGQLTNALAYGQSFKLAYGSLEMLSPMGRASIASLRAAELSYSLRAAQQKLYGQGILLAYGQLGRACLRTKLLPMGRACRERAAQHHYNIVKCDIYIYNIYK